MKCAGLTPFLIYIVFKFAWAYRLFNHVAILFGAMPGARGRRHKAGAPQLRTKTDHEVDPARGRPWLADRNDSSREFFALLPADEIKLQVDM